MDLLAELPPAPATALDFDSLHRLVITAELMAEVASPAEDDALRMQVQVERLQQTMGKGQAGTSGGAPVGGKTNLWLHQALQWCAAQPKPEGVEPLRQRLFAALEAGLNQDPPGTT